MPLAKLPFFIKLPSAGVFGTSGAGVASGAGVVSGTGVGVASGASIFTSLKSDKVIVDAGVGIFSLVFSSLICPIETANVVFISVG